ncbi:MAG: LysM peptidoglycan-binding domain-containing protein, partial [Bacteroidetes bacterium]
FLAGQYICRYYMEHGLMPQLPPADFLHTQTVMVYKSYSMFKISNVTGVALKTLKVLNPAYYDNYIPASQTGNYLTVPQRSFALLIEYVSEREGWKPFSNHQKSGYYATKWVVGKGDTLDKLAALCGATKYQIMKWNNLRTSELYNGQILHLYYAVPSVHTPGPKA